ncbi:19777_t:CDS:2, partial [Racocetra fulgida]
FIGIDISPMFPTGIKPPNLTFHTANVLKGLPFPDDHFDFVYMRFLIIAFTEDEWSTVISELIRVVKPGGWIELMEGNMEFEGEERSTPIGTWAGKIGEIASQDFCSLWLAMKGAICHVLEEKGVIRGCSCTKEYHSGNELYEKECKNFCDDNRLNEEYDELIKEIIR